MGKHKNKKGFKKNGLRSDTSKNGIHTFLKKTVFVVNLA
jgi:hypothetical protein